jgi:hypothetical protein
MRIPTEPTVHPASDPARNLSAATRSRVSAMVLNIGPPDAQSASYEDSEDGPNGIPLEGSSEMDDSGNAGKAHKAAGGKRGAAKGGKRVAGGRRKKVSYQLHPLGRY